MNNMRRFNIERINRVKKKLGENPITLKNDEYQMYHTRKGYLVDSNGNRIGTKGDAYHKKTIHYIFQHGHLDYDPRPKYIDEYENAKYKETKNNRILILENGEEKVLDSSQTIETVENKILLHTKAHTISVNGGTPEYSYDLSKGECPLTTLRPTALKQALAEIIWIYIKQSNDLVEFDELLGKNTWDKDHKINNWWEQWALRDANGNYILNEKGHPTIGTTYGEVIRRRNMLYTEVIEPLKSNPDGRRNICSMWQIDDYKEPHGLKPCAFMTIWNIRRGFDGKNYLDMSLIQRSSDFCTAATINQIQYIALMLLVARAVGVEPGIFTWKPVNVQIYDRHFDQAIEMMNREPITVNAGVKLSSRITADNIDDVKPNDFTVITDYERELIKKKNPQMPFPLGV